MDVDVLVYAKQNVIHFINHNFYKQFVEVVQEVV